MRPLHARFVRRQLAGAGSQTGIFILSVGLAMLTITSLDGFHRSVNEAVARDARSLQAADIIVHSHRDLPPGLTRAAAALRERGEAQTAEVLEFYSMARSGSGASLLAMVKAASPGYPFYGRVELASGRPFGEALTPGSAVVERLLLERLGLAVGDRLLLGQAALVIRDMVLREPDRPLSLFAMGPRVFVSLADLPSLGLVQTGSRVERRLLLKVADPRRLDSLSAGLQAAAGDQARVETFRTAHSGVKRFFDNFLFFLGLLGTFTLLLAGIGIQSAMTAFLREKRETVAVLKVLGAGGRFITTQYVAVVLLLGAAGSLLGLAGSLAVQRIMTLLFSGLLPEGFRPSLSWPGVAEGIALGLLATIIFTFLPLKRLREVTPAAIFRKEEAGLPRGFWGYLSAAPAALIFAGLVFWRVGDPRTGAWFLGGLAALVAVSFFAAEGLLRLLARARVRSLPLRQAVKSLFRPGNATRPVILTLTAALTVVLSLWLIQANLEAFFVTSYPLDMPNLFFLDIQSSQRDDFARALDRPAEFYPVVIGQVAAINGRPVERERNRESSPGRHRDSLTRDFYLTYRDGLLKDETLVRGGSLFKPEAAGPQVSVLEEVLDMAPLAVGDRVTFRLQGVPLEAVVSSIRRRTESTPTPFFYFVFPPDVLKDAPRTFFGATRVREGEIGPLQNRLASRFPNVTFIDVTAAVAAASGLIRKMTRVVRFFTLFSVSAGLIIMFSSILATRRARIQEAVFYKILGARRRFVLAVFTLEGILLGLAGGFLALLLSQAVAWAAVKWRLDIPYRPHPGAGAVLLAGTVCLTVAVGWLASRPILRHKPASYLRERGEE